jgi:hypothetical protein
MAGSGIVASLIQLAIYDYITTVTGSNDYRAGDDIANVYKSQPESSNGTAEEKQHVLNAILVSFVRRTLSVLYSYGSRDRRVT